MPLEYLIVKLTNEIKEIYGINYVCVAGAGQLKIKCVNGPYKIKVFDGYETVELL